MAFLYGSQGGLKQHLSLLWSFCNLLYSLCSTRWAMPALLFEYPYICGIFCVLFYWPAKTLQPHYRPFGRSFGSVHCVSYIKPVAMNFYVCVFSAHAGVFSLEGPQWERLGIAYAHALLAAARALQSWLHQLTRPSWEDLRMSLNVNLYLLPSP